MKKLSLRNAVQRYLEKNHKKERTNLDGLTPHILNSCSC